MRPIILLLSIAAGVCAQCGTQNQVCFHYRMVDLKNASQPQQPGFPEGFRVFAHLPRVNLTKVDIRTQEVQANVSITYELVSYNYDWGNDTETNATEKIGQHHDYFFARMPKFVGCNGTTVLNINQYSQSPIHKNGSTIASANMTTSTHCDMNVDFAPDDRHNCTLCLMMPGAAQFLVLVGRANPSVGNLAHKWEIGGLVITNAAASNATLQDDQISIDIMIARDIDNFNDNLVYYIYGTATLAVLAQIFTSYIWEPALIGLAIDIAAIILTEEYLYMHYIFIYVLLISTITMFGYPVYCLIFDESTKEKEE